MGSIRTKNKRKKILHFSPSKSIKNKLESIPNIEYITTDFAGEFNATKKLNIEAIDEPNNTYDIIICFHILEHIKNDSQAMSELLRILKPTGICIIQTPYKAGGIYEDDNIVTDKDRRLHFGQEDHVRIYSFTGLENRLINVGFKTKRIDFNEVENNKNGYSTEEHIIIAEK